MNWESARVLRRERSINGTVPPVRPPLPPLVGICEKFGVTLSEFFAFNENEKKSSLTDKLTGIAKDLETEDLQVLIKVAEAFRKKK